MTKHIEKVQQARKNKLDNLFKKKYQEDTNPNNITWTLNLRTLSKEEYEVFHF